ncbi:MAG: LPXTG cell wall anchor domain-containing protein [Patiriisocius sp.]|uniref:LPXTG cell wall anchor domain-containing protein n=1 Tax=Patiriisocius sp. TaxID=2822396 RepID=UPI003EF7C529
MEYFDGINPMLLILGGMVLLAGLYFWNKKNTQTNRERRKRSFRERYNERKRENEK